MAHLLGGLATPFLCKPITASSSSSSSKHNYTSNLAFDSLYIKRAAELADKSAGFTAPHPNFGCVIAVPNGGGTVVGEGYLYAEGTAPAEVQAVEAAGEQGRGATAYFNMEPGDCHCDSSAVSALIKAGISRVVVGIRHPLQHLCGNAIRALRSEGLQVDVLGEDIQNKTIEVTPEIEQIASVFIPPCLSLLQSWKYQCQRFGMQEFVSEAVFSSSL